MINAAGLTPEQQQTYDRDGWIAIPSMFSDEECDGLIAHMKAVHAGQVPVPGFVPPADGADALVDMDQCHLFDPVCRDFMLHPKLRTPLRDAMGGDEPEGIKSHYWWKGSQWSQGWHCDGTALPGCVGVWIPLVDVDEAIGTLALQSGGHRRRILHHDDLRSGKWAGQRTHTGDPELGARLKKEIFEENQAAGCEEIRIVASRGTAVIFDGYLWHRGVMGRDPSAFRQVYACHYVPRGFAEWPHVLWERIDFDGVRRWSTGDEPTPAARHNARLPRHPAMELTASAKHPSLLPTRRDAPLQILGRAQADDLDLRGFTVVQEAFDAGQLASLRHEVGPAGRPGTQAADGTTGPSEPSRLSALARSLCGVPFFQQVCHDVLNCDDVRLYQAEVVVNAPCPERATHYRQEIGHSFVEPPQYLICWVALDDTTERHGCLRFVPGLHRRGALRHEYDAATGVVSIADLCAADAVSVPLSAGSVALFWSLTPYAIGANRSDAATAACVCRYGPDGYDDRIWDHTANGGRGGPMPAARASATGRRAT